nr:hypothetical protein BaRGS_021162 [Batillaria attramentaria]
MPAPTGRMTGEEEQLTENDQWSDPAFILRDVLISRVTWSMWCVNLTGGLGFVYIWNYWKAYGQTFIRDDHFLALVGSCAGIVGAVARPLMGWMAQRIGSLSCYWLAFSLLTVTSATFVVCEYAGKPMYFAWVCLMYMAIGIYYTIYTPLYYALFGARYFSFALGVVSTSGVLYLLVVPVSGCCIDGDFGLAWRLFLSAACEFLALVFSVSLRFDCGGTIPAHMKRELFARKRKDMERTE